VLGLALIAVVVAGCGGSSGSSGTEQSKTATAGSTGGGSAEEAGSSSTSALVEEARKLVAEAEKEPTEAVDVAMGAFTPKPGGNLYVISCDKQFEGCHNADEAIAEAAKAIGYQEHECDARISEPESTSACFKSAENAHPDAVLVVAIGETEAGNGFAELAQAGIPVIGVATGTVASERVDISGKKWTEEEGEVVGAFDVAEGNGETKVLVPVVKSFPSVLQRVEGMKKFMGKCSGCEIHEVEVASNAIEKLPQLLQAEMQSNPEYDFITSNLNLMGTLTLEAVRNSGRTDMTVTTVDGVAPNLEALRAGELAFDYSFAQVEIGWQMVDAAARLFAGEPVPKILDTTGLAITEKNIGNFSGLYEGAPNFRQSYEELWGKS
jgi:ribose transport system substrate-binding protein